MTISHRPAAVQPTASLDPYTLRLERIRGEISALKSLNNGARHTSPVGALFVTATPPNAGNVQISATWVAPSNNPELGAALFHAGLMALRQQAPGVFAQLLERTRADGMIGQTVP